jgi:malonate decarboxylase alpha subunit
VHSFGSELGMEDYIRARPMFSSSARRHHAQQPRLVPGRRPLCLRHVHRLDLQIDLQGNSSTATAGRIAGFGGAPTWAPMRAAAVTPARPGSRPASRRAGRNTIPRGQKLVVQMVETFREHMQPAFVEKLDAWRWPSRPDGHPPVMIYGDDVTHILTEEGIANLLLCRTDEEREQAIRGVAGYTPVGLGATSAWWRTCATAASSARRRPGHRQAHGHARPAGRPQYERPGARLGRAVQPPKRFRNW